MSKKSPQLRFEGFTDDWEQRKLKDIVNRVTRKNKNLESTLPLTISAQYGLVDQITFFNKQIASKDMSGYYLLQKGEFAYNKSYSKDFPWGAIKRLNMYDEGVLSTLYIAFLPFKVNSDFLVSYYETDGWHKEVAIRAAEGARNHGLLNITAVDFFDTGLMIPPNNDEQQEIGGFFIELDHTITLHQRKLDLLKEQKKGFLQKMFPKNGAKVPELRFAGFADDWEERKLGDVVGEIQSGNRLPKDSLTSGNIPYVVAQTKNEGVFKTISKKTLDYNGNPMKLFPGNSISFSIDNPEAMFYRSTEFYTSNIMRVIHADYLSHQQYLFILENMKSFTRGYDWSRKFSGPVVSNLEYLQPNEQEQCKIGSFILAFDNIITLHQRKLDLLKEQKKGFLQKMFPKNGAKVPELRFAGFADDWEERKLGDVFSERSERSSEGELISVTINSGVVKASELDRKDNSSNDKSNYKKVEVGDIAYNSMRMWQGASGYSSYDGILSPAYTVIIPKEGTDSKFFAYDFKRHDMIQTFKRNSQGLTSDTWNLKFPTLKSVKVMVPCMEEQTKISNFFERLDTTITLHRRKLDLLKEQKKGFLQKMFV